MSKSTAFSTHWHFFSANVRAILSGQLRSKDGNQPKSHHTIPSDFAGICVATSSNTNVDTYIINQLKSLGIEQVRLDVTYGDEHNHVSRFLQQLLALSFKVNLHLIQPFSAAQAMQTEVAQTTWRDFVVKMCEAYGQQVAHIEIGSTVNRKRWSGYDLQGFLTAWHIAFEEIKSRGIQLAGPNVTDFEPFYNIGLLAILQKRGQLPDIHTNNLFSERCTEPERDDHKILGRQLASLAAYRLVKKAAVLQKIGAYYGVADMHSPSAFWTIPRIERLLPDGEQKQADYLARYMLLCAASGSLKAANWGPFICHREGLIDDNVRAYPKLERVTHYASVGDNPEQFRIRPAFDAYKTFAGLIPAKRYLGQLKTSDGIEAHAFSDDNVQLHAIWTINGKAATLCDIYHAENLNHATFINRDGDVLDSAPSLATESPLYIKFNRTNAVEIKPNASAINALAIHVHAPNKTHYRYQQTGWQGLILASSKQEAELLAETLNPPLMAAPLTENTLRHARNAIWTILDPRDASKKLAIKRPVKMHVHKKWLDRHKPSKALRSWSGASELLRRGIANAQPIAYFEKTGDSTLMQNYYVCEYVEAICSVRDAFSAFARGDSDYKEITPEVLYPALCDYLYTMHSRGVFFRDLSGGNILIIKQDDSTINFSLIDTARAHFFNHGTALYKRLSDLARACNKLHPQGREVFMSMYMAKLGKQFDFWHRLPFYLYNTKVALKRYSKRKSWIKLLKK